MPVVLKAKKLRRISKAQLCIIFNCTTANGRTDGRKLQKEYLTRKFQKEVLKLSKKQYQKIKSFSISHTKIILQHFDISQDELNQFL